MMSEAASFRIVKKGYDPAEVDLAFAQLREALVEARSAAEEGAAEVTRLSGIVAALRRTLALHRPDGSTEPAEAAAAEADNTSDADSTHNLGDDAVESALSAQDEEGARA